MLQGVCADLQITATQREKAVSRYRSIGEWLEGTATGILRGAPVHIYPQGSLRIGTTNKPINAAEFDLDIVAEIQVDARFIHPPISLLHAVEARLREHGTYSEMLVRKNRCIRVVYADEFHLDVLPACPDPARTDGSIVVADRAQRCWKPSNPNGYADWIELRAEHLSTRLVKAMAPLPAVEPSESKPLLKKIIQLMKRHRDIEFAGTEHLAPVSIVLTTLAGIHVSGGPSILDMLEQTLVVIAANSPSDQVLKVYNPTNTGELLSERWENTRGSYEAFREWTIAFIRKLRELRAAVGLPAVIYKLVELFGERPVYAARKAMIDTIEGERRLGRLGAGANGSLLISPVIAERPAIVRNTFFGD
ncbi:MAG: nucleotidyltransferase [Myxococcota bacterium]